MGKGKKEKAKGKRDRKGMLIVDEGGSQKLSPLMTLHNAKP